MNTTVNKNRENLPSSHEEKHEKQAEKTQASKEVKEAADFGKAAYVEAVGLDESAETMGRVSEVLSGNKDDDKSGGNFTGAKAKAFDPAQIKAQLLTKMPSEKAMRKQIEKEIRKEIDYLHSKAMKMLRKPGDANYFEMSNILKKIRELKGLLLTLVKASVDSLKTLWLRYVHGVM